MRLELAPYHYAKACAFTDADEAADDTGNTEAGSYPRMVLVDTWESCSEDGLLAMVYRCPKCQTEMCVDLLKGDPT